MNHWNINVYNTRSRYHKGSPCSLNADIVLAGSFDAGSKDQVMVHGISAYLCDRKVNNVLAEQIAESVTFYFDY